MLAKRSPGTAPGRTSSVRIIGGTHRGSKLPVPDLPGLRPTPDRVRETLYNWLRPRLPGSRVLDLFAGSGVLGLEAASQGAAEVVLVEADARAAASLRSEVVRLQLMDRCQVMQARAPEVLDQLQPFDLILLDPPYAADGWAACLQRIAARQLLRAEGRIYLEWPEPGAPPAADGWQWQRRGRAGSVGFGLLSA